MTEINGEGKHTTTEEEKESVVKAFCKYYRVCDSGLPKEGDRLHTCVEGRYVTIFRHKSVLSSIDSVCHHASGPLTLGKIQDIEELDMTVVLCPWHNWMVCINKGVKAYRGVDIINGVPKPSGWKIGKVVQRAHIVREDDEGVYLSLVVDDSVECASDFTSYDSRCVQKYSLHDEEPTLFHK